jgi:hypothetical protein
MAKDRGQRIEDRGCEISTFQLFNRPQGKSTAAKRLLEPPEKAAAVGRSANFEAKTMFIRE